MIGPNRKSVEIHTDKHLSCVVVRNLLNNYFSLVGISVSLLDFQTGMKKEVPSKY